MTKQTQHSADTQTDLVSSLKDVIRSGEEMIATLAALESSPRRFDGPLKEQFLEVVARIEAVTSALESRVTMLSRSETALWLDRLELLVETWTRVYDQVEWSVARAIAGSIERGFMFLSPIANCANLDEGRRLRRLQLQLAKHLYAPTDSKWNAVIADPDLAGVDTSYEASISRAMLVGGSVPGHASLGLATRPSEPTLRE